MNISDDEYCTLYIVHCTSYIVQCTLAQCILDYIQYIVYIYISCDNLVSYILDTYIHKCVLLHICVLYHQFIKYI